MKLVKEFKEKSQYKRITLTTVQMCYECINKGPLGKKGWRGSHCLRLGRKEKYGEVKKERVERKGCRRKRGFPYKELVCLLARIAKKKL